MTFMQCNFFSRAIGSSTTINVLYPQLPAAKKIPTLYLLHGYSEDHTTWHRRTALERYVSQYEIAVVMPDAQRSFYCDFPGPASGYKYWTYVSQELLDITRQLFHLSEKREDTFAAGLSMGGFGAFKLALNFPDKFGAAASLSGPLDSEMLLQRPSTLVDPGEWKLCLGESAALKGSVNDLKAQATKSSILNEKPRLYQCCGTEDFLYEDNVSFRDHIRPLGFDYTYDEGPGAHTWDYWEMQIQNVLAWLPLRKLN